MTVYSEEEGKEKNEIKAIIVTNGEGAVKNIIKGRIMPETPKWNSENPISKMSVVDQETSRRLDGK